MSSTLIALMFGASSGVWVYTRLMRSTGGNAKSSIIASSIIGVLAFMVFFLLIKAVVPSSN